MRLLITFMVAFILCLSTQAEPVFIGTEYLGTLSEFKQAYSWGMVTEKKDGEEFVYAHTSQGIELKFSFVKDGMNLKIDDIRINGKPYEFEDSMAVSMIRATIGAFKPTLAGFIYE